jgi:hypothetical protein
MTEYTLYIGGASCLSDLLFFCVNTVIQTEQIGKKYVTIIQSQNATHNVQKVSYWYT